MNPCHADPLPHPRGCGEGRSLLLLIPNLLTLSRLPLAAAVWLRPLDPLYVLALMFAAGLTDVLDGWLERRLRGPGPRESVGAWLDPLCDKIFIVSTLVAIAVAHSLPFWMIPAIALREILQFLIALSTRLVPAVRRRLRMKFQANVRGKLATVIQFAAIAAILFGHPAGAPLALATAVAGLLAVGSYVRRALTADGK